MGRINILPILQIVHYNILNPTPPWTLHCLVRFSSPSLFKLPYDPFHTLFFTLIRSFPSLSFHCLMFLHIPHSSLPSEPSHHSLFTTSCSFTSLTLRSPVNLPITLFPLPHVPSHPSLITPQ